MFMSAADLLVSEGYADLGYKYVIVDDCWLAKNRSVDGKLEADKKRFPSGIKALSDYVNKLLNGVKYMYFIRMNNINNLKQVKYSYKYKISTKI